MSWRHTCRQPPQRKRVIVSSSVVGRCPNGSCASHAVARHALGTAVGDTTGRTPRLDTTGEHRTIRLEPLTHYVQPEFLGAAERRQVRTSEGSVKHVEVFRMGGVRTPIIGRPRRSPRLRRARRYIINPEEPY
jgi:hypothetical protein